MYQISTFWLQTMKSVDRDKGHIGQRDNKPIWPNVPIMCNEKLSFCKALLCPNLPGYFLKQLTRIRCVELHSEVKGVSIGASQLATQPLADIQPVLEGIEVLQNVHYVLPRDFYMFSTYKFKSNLTYISFVSQ